MGFNFIYGNSNVICGRWIIYNYRFINYIFKMRWIILINKCILWNKGYKFYGICNRFFGIYWWGRYCEKCRNIIILCIWFRLFMYKVWIEVSILIEVKFFKWSNNFEKMFLGWLCKNWWYLVNKNIGRYD